jgi:hypothetical protein
VQLTVSIQPTPILAGDIVHIPVIETPLKDTPIATRTTAEKNNVK